MTTIRRKTNETEVEVRIGDPAGGIATEVPFLDHMLHTLARYSGLPLSIQARGDLLHHLVEDVAIALGTAVAGYTPTAAARYGERTIPMDDALVQCVIDLGGRPYYRGPLPSALYEHWMRSFSDNARSTLHIRVLRGSDRHHIVEAAFKALGLALRDALRETGHQGVFSTKGAVLTREESA
ncbi:MAG: imidazoleglycerol-phosphate dehydratase [Gemmatimonadaceae bacterium]